MTELLDDADVERNLGALPGWRRDGDTIRSLYACADFAGAMALTNAVAAAAEAADHHPDIDIRYNRVSFTLTSHSDGGLTGKDFALAGAIDRAAADGGAAPAGQAR